MHKRLPKDLRQYSVRRALFRIIPCGILLLVFGIVLALFGERVFNTENQMFRVSCYAVTMLLPFAVTGVPFRLLDRTYWGTVDEVQVKTTAESVSSVKPSLESLYQKNTVYVTVRLPNGKRIHKKVCEGRAEHTANFESYHKDDRVFHLYGTRYTVVLPKETDSLVQCAVCGDQNATTEECCRNCGHTLIKDFN